MSWLIILVVLIILFLSAKVINSLQYWKNKGVPSIKPWPLFGNMASTFFRTKAFASALQDFYNKFSDKRYFGFYQFSTPILVVRDPLLIKKICLKDFDNFTDHQEFLPESSDPFWDKNLFSMTGKNWHDMRSVLSPTYTSSKMKSMFCLMTECAQELLHHLNKKEGTVTLEMKDIFLRFTNNVIASTAFGIKVDSFGDENNEFFRMGQNAFNFDGFKSLKFFGQGISPTLMKILNVRFFDEYTKQFFLEIVRNTIKHREETGLVRPDMIHLLREVQKGRLNHDEVDVLDSGFAVVQESNIGKIRNQNRTLLTDEDLAAQATIFFFGAFHTVASLMRHLAYELAINPEVQQKLLEEVDRTLEESGGQITYEALLGMKYLDMAISETLRMWPPAIFTNRKALKRYTIPPEKSDEKALHIEPELGIWFPMYAIHRDPQYHPNPNKFDPERFSDENKHKIQPFTYFPFGAGPRNCIGSRFALLETKTVIFFILAQYEFVPVEKTQIPFVFSKNNVFITSDAGYWLGLKPRRKAI